MIKDMEFYQSKNIIPFSPPFIFFHVFPYDFQKFIIIYVGIKSLNQVFSKEVFIKN